MNWDTISDLEDDYLAYANFAYSQYTEWFGKPDDENWQYILFTAPQSFCVRISRDKQYHIGIKTTGKEYSACYQSIGHEMFHRVNHHKKLLKETLWLNETMATLASLKLLEVHQMEKYVHSFVSYIVETPSRMSLDELLTARLLPKWLVAIKQKTLFPDTYPRGFARESICMGQALSSLFTWSEICELLNSSSLDTWIASLDPISQKLMQTLLNGSTQNYNIPIEYTSKWGVALYYLGRKKESVKYLGEAIRMKQADSKALQIFNKLTLNVGIKPL